MRSLERKLQSIGGVAETESTVDGGFRGDEAGDCFAPLGRVADHLRHQSPQ